ncbi:MAG: tRNA cyclic N6-threonylcarbamoyladenosine(37) synthase TcdA [Gammaproteobacteria bacterium]|jgi:tRNA A37 threonylcarbamoyladenosine dehydratase|nr:tRNA cyclic N6-threonylcarbamoyladenosine(37) synthase TcdA [Gammaproteobacteria bacterium]
MSEDDNFQERFGGIQRLYGKQASEILKNLHVCVVGLGGVGSWAVEALARTGIGQITMIDYDTVSIGNINRQLPALGETVGEKKFSVLEKRVNSINPNCICHTIDDFLTSENLTDYLSTERAYDYVIDAIDSITFKAEMIYYCKRNKIPIITTGGAGGLTDPTMVQVKDLSRTINDPLAAKVRSRLRSEHGFTRTPKRYFRVECVFSTQLPVYPKPDGSVSHEKPGIHGISLDCSMGYGSASFVTATFGNVAVARLISKTLKKRLA